MNAQDRDALLDKLIDLMSLHRHDSYDMRGLPFVNEDGSFGLTAGKKNGGLHAAYFLTDSLRDAGLLSGGQPKTDLDTAMYTLRQGMVFEVCDGAKLIRSDEENEITVTIDARPLPDIMAALDKGIEAANAEHRRSAKSSIKYRAERLADRAREKMAPVVTQFVDETLVTAYLTMRVYDEFPRSDITIEPAAPLPAEVQEQLDDRRPRLSVSFNHPAGENYARFHDFHSGLGKVFNGSCAVMATGGDVRDNINISGYIPRLAADILEHDTKGARRVLGLLESKAVLDAADIAVYTAHVDRFDAIKSFTEGVSQPLKVGGTLKIKTQP
ncbi:MAG: hypothetical protein ACAH80_11600 [Alphaproteobacteria bacterium]